MKFLSFIFFAVLLTACKTKSNSSNDQANNGKKDQLEIYAFHGTRQCETCKHMKAYTKTTLEKNFKSELKSGEIVYQVIDVDDEKNYELAEKFEATGTALMVNKIRNGKDNIEDWSNFAFEYAPGNLNDFEPRLKKMIQEKLK
ncbi:MAG: hypothetical protein FGM14_10650 [Flavobacteriales bacterium]|nr:hypothetical protein [Flavobacteriales bacterium]